MIVCVTTIENKTVYINLSNIVDIFVECNERYNTISYMCTSTETTLRVDDFNLDSFLEQVQSFID